MPSRQSLSPVWSDEFIAALLTEMANATPTGLTLDSGLLKLFVGDTVPTPATVAGDFTVPTFTGYANATITDLFTTQTQPGQRAIFCNSIFQRTGGAVDDVVTGYFFTLSTGELVLSERFAEAVPFSSVGVMLDLGVYFPINQYVSVPQL